MIAKDRYGNKKIPANHHDKPPGSRSPEPDPLMPKKYIKHHSECVAVKLFQEHPDCGADWNTPQCGVYWGMKLIYLPQDQYDFCWPWQVRDDPQNPCCLYAKGQEYNCKCRCVEDPIHYPNPGPGGIPIPPEDCSKLAHIACELGFEWGWDFWYQRCGCIDQHNEEAALRFNLYTHTVPYCNFWDAPWFDGSNFLNDEKYCGMGYNERCCWWYDLGMCSPEDWQNLELPPGGLTSCSDKCETHCANIDEDYVNSYPNNNDVFGPPAPWNGWTPSGYENQPDEPGCTTNGVCRHCTDLIPNNDVCNTASTWCLPYSY